LEHGEKGREEAAEGVRELVGEDLDAEYGVAGGDDKEDEKGVGNRLRRVPERREDHAHLVEVFHEADDAEDAEGTAGLEEGRVADEEDKHERDADHGEVHHVPRVHPEGHEPVPDHVQQKVEREHPCPHPRAQASRGAARRRQCGRDP
jgi:hypothetical protein